MDKTLQSAIDALELLARCNEKLIALAVEVRRESRVREVDHAMQCRRYEPRSMLEGYVDAEVESGNAITWWVEADWSQGGCEVRASVLIRTDAGQDALETRPAVTASTFGAFEDELTGAVDWLLSRRHLLSAG